MTTPLSTWRPRRYLRHGMLPQLAAFEAVMRLGSTTRAAEALCIAQPTLSGHLRKLGEALGVRLFEMQGKRLVPTAAARALLPVAREVFAAFERCERVLAGLRAEACVEVRSSARRQADAQEPIGAAALDTPPAVAAQAWRGLGGPRRSSFST